MHGRQVARSPVITNLVATGLLPLHLAPSSLQLECQDSPKSIQERPKRTPKCVFSAPPPCSNDVPQVSPRGPRRPPREFHSERLVVVVVADISFSAARKATKATKKAQRGSKMAQGGSKRAP